MSDNPKFLVGEPVERIVDGLVGKVVRVDPWHNGGFAYAVDPSREPMQGHADDIWSGTEGAWRSMRRGHAHVVQNSRDCDGDYEHRHVDRPNALERTEEFGDLAFKERVMGSVVSLHAEGALTVTPEGMHWNQPTDEGYVHTEVWWCDEDDCDDKSTQRDFRAESMGY